MTEIDELIKQLISTPDGKDKDFDFFFLTQKIKVLRDTKLITQEQSKKYFKLLRNLFPTCTEHINDDVDKCYDYLVEQKERLSNLYEKVLLYAKNYEFKTIELLDINQYRIGYITEFFKWLNVDILEIYNEIFKRGLIYDYPDLNSFGTTYRIAKDKCAILINSECSGIQYLSTLVHEIGHAYYFYLTKDNQELTLNFLPSECLPKAIDKLFITYVRENNLIKKDVIDSFEYNKFLSNLLYMDCSYVMNNNPNVTKDNWHKIDMSFKEYKEKSIIKPKIFVGYKELLPIYQNRYSYGTLFTFATQDKFLKDNDWGRKFIKEFPMLTRKLSSEELINLFTEDEYINSVNNEADRILTKKHI